MAENLTQHIEELQESGLTSADIAYGVTGATHTALESRKEEVISLKQQRANTTHQLLRNGTQPSEDRERCGEKWKDEVADKMGTKSLHEDIDGLQCQKVKQQHKVSKSGVDCLQEQRDTIQTLINEAVMNAKKEWEANQERVLQLLVEKQLRAAVSLKDEEILNLKQSLAEEKQKSKTAVLCKDQEILKLKQELDKVYLEKDRQSQADSQKLTKQKLEWRQKMQAAKRQHAEEMETLQCLMFGEIIKIETEFEKVKMVVNEVIDTEELKLELADMLEAQLSIDV